MQAYAQSSIKSDFPEIFCEEGDAVLDRRLEYLERSKSTKRYHTGPPDLVFIQRMVRVSSNGPPRTLTSYHHCIGVDVSNTATVSAYINQLLCHQNFKADTGGLFSRRRAADNAAEAGKIFRVVYCSYDAFESREVRIEAHIPGSVRSFSISDLSRRDLGVMQPMDAAQWSRVAMSAAIRAIVYASCDDPGLVNIGDAKAVEVNILGNAGLMKPLFFQLGSPDHSNRVVPSNRRNHVMTSVCEYGRKNPMFLLEFSEKTDDVALKAMALLLLDRQSEAIDTMQHYPELDASQQSSILLLQSHLIESKNLQDAISLLKRAISLCPLDVDLWIELSRLQIDASFHREALWSLNSSMPGAHILANKAPVPPALYISSPIHIHRDQSVEHLHDLAMTKPEKIKEQLAQLKAERLEGSMLEIYSLLCKLADILGWDGLLDLRQSCFVMEQDYIHFGQRDPQLSPTTQAVLQTEKRVCERWLDDMFGMLYEDLRVYAVFSNELEHVNKQSGEYTRSSREWVALGGVCERLNKTKVPLSRCCVHLLTMI